MSDWELLSHDASMGVRKYIQADQHVEDAVLVKTEFDDVSALIDANKAAQAENTGRMGDMVHAASIPIAVMYEWLTKYGVNAWRADHMDGVKRLLNSGDYRYLKVRNIIL